MFGTFIGPSYPPYPVPPPVYTPITRTWKGGDTNLASNPNHWSPTGTPRPGDKLIMSGGTMNASGNDLQGDNVYVGPSQANLPVTFNFNGSVSANIETAGTMPAPGSPAVTVNLGRASVWTGGLNAGPYGGPTTIQGDGRFDNTSSLIDNIVTVGVDVIGRGLFTTEQAHGPGTRLEFAHAVSASQRVVVTGGGYGTLGSTVQIDRPGDYHADTTLGYGEIILKGITASSYALRNDMLQLYGASGQPVYRMSLHAQPPPYPIGQTGFGISQVGGDIYVHADGSSYRAGGTTLTMHTV